MAEVECGDIPDDDELDVRSNGGTLVEGVCGVLGSVSLESGVLGVVGIECGVCGVPQPSSSSASWLEGAHETKESAGDAGDANRLAVSGPCMPPRGDSGNGVRLLRSLFQL